MLAAAAASAAAAVAASSSCAAAASAAAAAAVAAAAAASAAVCHHHARSLEWEPRLLLESVQENSFKLTSKYFVETLNSFFNLNRFSGMKNVDA